MAIRGGWIESGGAAVADSKQQAAVTSCFQTQGHRDNVGHRTHPSLSLIVVPGARDSGRGGGTAASKCAGVVLGKSDW